MKLLMKLIERRDGHILKHNCFRNKDRAITATLAKAFEGAEEEDLVRIFKDVSCSISIGYTVFKTFYGLLSFPCNKIQDLGKRKVEKEK